MKLHRVLLVASGFALYRGITDADYGVKFWMFAAALIAFLLAALAKSFDDDRAAGTNDTRNAIGLLLVWHLVIRGGWLPLLVFTVAGVAAWFKVYA